MEEQHAIPQQISAYQFRLVGDMTLKQFFQVAGGALVALIIYSTSIAALIKWPLILISFLFGVALAFFPIEDRPLEKWIVAFFKSIYSPTIFVWKKSEKKRRYFRPEKAGQEPPLTVAPPKPGEVTPPPEVSTEPMVQITPEATGLEQTEQEFLSKVAQHLGEPTEKLTSGIITETIEPTTPVKPGARRRVSVPQTAPARVEKEEKKPGVVIEEAAPRQMPYSEPRPSTARKVIGATQAKFSQEAAPPNPPTQPNIVVGQVLDTEGKIVEAAILEIRDEEGRPARALKTNKLGHFMIVTPLVNGKYNIITEKEGLQFKPIILSAEGNIIPPIAIWAKEKKDGETGVSKEGARDIYSAIKA